MIMQMSKINNDSHHPGAHVIFRKLDVKEIPLGSSLTSDFLQTNGHHDDGNNYRHKCRIVH